MSDFTFTSLGQFWAASGDLFTMTHLTDKSYQARVYVDSLGETWVDIRRIPQGGYFHTERVEGFRVTNAADAKKELCDRGYGYKRIAPGAHRVHENPAPRRGRVSTDPGKSGGPFVNG